MMVAATIRRAEKSEAMLQVVSKGVARVAATERSISRPQVKRKNDRFVGISDARLAVPS